VQVFDTAELGQEKEFFFLLYRTKQRLPTLAAGVRFFFPQKAADVPWTLDIFFLASTAIGQVRCSLGKPPPLQHWSSPNFPFC
jgi:hypothetical protein